jgi:hypothetical protein
VVGTSSRREHVKRLQLFPVVMGDFSGLIAKAASSAMDNMRDSIQAVLEHKQTLNQDCNAETTILRIFQNKLRQLASNIESVSPDAARAIRFEANTLFAE